MPEEFPGEGWYIVTMGNWSTDEEYESGRGSNAHELWSAAYYFDETGYCTTVYFDPCLASDHKSVGEAHPFADLASMINEENGIYDFFWFKLTDEFYETNKDLFKIEFTKPEATPTKYDALKQNKNVPFPKEFPGEGWYIITQGNWSSDEEYEIKGIGEDVVTIASYFNEEGKGTSWYFHPCLSTVTKASGEVLYSDFLFVESNAKENNYDFFWFKLTDEFYEAHKDLFKIELTKPEATPTKYDALK